MKFTIVGSGIAGLISGLVLSKKGHEVRIIEAGSEVGGLYRTARTVDGLAFDFGSHIPLSSGIEELDEMVFGNLPESDWWAFNSTLKEYGYFNGALNDKSQCLDVRGVKKDLYDRIVLQTMNLSPDENGYENLESHMIGNYGEALTNEILRPVLKKIAGWDLSELAPNALPFFGLQRSILFNDFITRKLKSIPFFDDRIADTNARVRESDTWKYYPKSGGCGKFTDELVKQLENLGVEITVDEAVVSGEEGENGTVKSIRLKSGEVIESDYIIWTAPPIFFMKTLGMDCSQFGPLPFRSVALYHFVYDQASLTDGHYIYCYEPEWRSYRTSIFPNLTLDPVCGPPHHLTVEVFLNDKDEDAEALLPQIWEEQIKMGLVPEAAKATHQEVQVIPHAWPVQIPEFFDSLDKQRNAIENRYSNLLLIGRASGDHHMIPQMRRIWKRLVEEKSFSSGRMHEDGPVDNN